LENVDFPRDAFVVIINRSIEHIASNIEEELQLIRFFSARSDVCVSLCWTKREGFALSPVKKLDNAPLLRTFWTKIVGNVDM